MRLITLESDVSQGMRNVMDKRRQIRGLHRTVTVVNKGFNLQVRKWIRSHFERHIAANVIDL